MDVFTTRKGNKIYTLDHHFQGITSAIASYLIPHSMGGILVETGPGSTTDRLVKELNNCGYDPSDINDVFLTHIHLDHAGAAGWFASMGANIYVHHIGAPHLKNPEKLLSSAARLYGDKMNELWGEFIPVPHNKIIELEDGTEISINGLQIKALDTPGHASHHHAYLFEDVLFSGDIGGIRMRNLNHIRLPMPPPEFNLELWKNSAAKLLDENRNGSFSSIAPTHFGIFTDADWHMFAINSALDEIDTWMNETMPAGYDLKELNERFLDWTEKRSLEEGLTLEQIQPYEAANPSWMSTYGISRYWRKKRQHLIE
jgi:glyoxylase-like metal-dependent hydrolase (beta-lactamase superfamily II)